MIRPTHLLVAVSVIAVTACTRSSIEWRDATELPGALASASELTFGGGQQLVPRHPVSVPLPVFAGQCAGSVRVARDTVGDWYSVWWSVRPDSTADLVVSRSRDGIAWLRPVRVDTTDVGQTGCDRPTPSIAVDGPNVHVAYAMTAREGPGIFASHSMDGGTMFHTPVTVAYGERLGRAAITARGDVVAVAYEDPNTTPPRVGVAFSRTMGHTFESRELVSPASAPADAPGIALGTASIAVTWKSGAGSGAAAPRMLRVGTLR